MLYLKFDPHAEEDGSSVENEPRDAAGKQFDALKSGKEERQKNDECCDDPDDQDPLVADVEEGEPHVSRQLFHRLNEFFNSQLRLLTENKFIL